jgi:hypothetical protein
VRLALPSITSLASLVLPASSALKLRVFVESSGSFSQLLHELAPVGQSALAAACAALITDGWMTRAKFPELLRTE